MRRIVPSLAAVVALALAAPSAAQADCAGADVPLTGTTADGARAAVLCLANAERTARGLPSLAADARLDQAAGTHAVDMALRDFFSHVAPSPAPLGATIGDRVAAVGFDAWAWGENIALGYRTPRAVMDGWMRSEGHCRNLLDAVYTHLGIGVDAGGATWAQAFGTPAGTRTPGDGAPAGACPAAGLGTGVPGPIPGATGDQQPDVQSDPAPAAAPAVPKASLAKRGRRILVRGRAKGASKVKVTVRRGARRRTVTVRTRKGGNFSVRVTPPRGRGGLQVVVRSAAPAAPALTIVAPRRW